MRSPEGYGFSSGKASKSTNGCKSCIVRFALPLLTQARLHGPASFYAPSIMLKNQSHMAAPRKTLGRSHQPARNRSFRKAFRSNWDLVGFPNPKTSSCSGVMFCMERIPHTPKIEWVRANAEDVLIPWRTKFRIPSMQRWLGSMPAQVRTI